MSSVPTALIEAAYQVAKDLEEKTPSHVISAADVIAKLAEIQNPEFVAYVSSGGTNRWISTIFKAYRFRDHWKPVGTRAGDARTLWTRRDRDVRSNMADVVTSVQPQPSPKTMQLAMKELKNFYNFAKMQGYRTDISGEEAVRKTMEWVRGICGGDTW